MKPSINGRKLLWVRRPIKLLRSKDSSYSAGHILCLKPSVVLHVETLRMKWTVQITALTPRFRITEASPVQRMRNEFG